MNNTEFVKKCMKALDVPTLYVYGGFGLPLNDRNKKRLINSYPYNRKQTRKNMIEKATDNTFAFDCVNLIKAIMWGWYGDSSKIYGGAIYNTSVFPDTDADGIMRECYGISTDFSNIEIGELVHINGHVGVYIGEGQVIECTPAWKNGVQITNCNNIKVISGKHGRTWKNHGKLKNITYVKLEKNKTQEEPIENNEDSEYLLHLVRRTIRGDFGNGANRKRILGDMYTPVMIQVNKNDKHNNKTWDSIKLYK